MANWGSKLSLQLRILGLRSQKKKLSHVQINISCLIFSAAYLFISQKKFEAQVLGELKYE
jgi:hypothetical protein